MFRICEMAGVSRAGFYRHWEQKAPDEAEMALRDAVQRAALANRYYGYRRIAYRDTPPDRSSSRQKDSRSAARRFGG